MPANISGSSINSLGCSSFRRSTLLGKKEDVLQCSMGHRTISLSVSKMNNHILSSVSRQSTKDLLAWKRDEEIVYTSRLVNIGIDKFCAENNTKITSPVRQKVFTLISDDLGIRLDPNAAQSSITHIINGNGLFGEKTAYLCKGMGRGEKNKLTDMLANHLADKFFEGHINTNIDIKRLQNDVESYILRANAIREK